MILLRKWRRGGESDIIEDMWQRIKNIYHLENAFLANLWFGFPSRQLTVIGVTGTDGKTTTTGLIYHILHKAGHNVSMISSVGAIIGGKEYDVGFHVTTPSPWDLQRFIKKAVISDETQGSQHPLNDSPKPNGNTRLVNENISVSTAALHSNYDYKETVKSSFRGDDRPSPVTPRYLVLEVTSHALDQLRVFGIKFDIGILTNVTHEHLDYHKTYENYVKTKAKLLKMATVAVVNRDDESYGFISKLKTQNSKLQLKTQKFITYGLSKNSDINPNSFPFKTNMIGEFNVYNSLAAIASCKELGISDEDIKRGLKSFKPPVGREDIVYDKDFTVMVDFAHTPNSFEQILSSVSVSIKGRLIHVFGAAGERDASKRPEMGRISAKYSDVIILTAEDPRSESVDKISGEIESGIMNHELRKKIILKIPDRMKAIETAIKMAKKGDLVLITGKSHEKSMNYGKGEEPWDEFKAVKKALKYV